MYRIHQIKLKIGNDRKMIPDLIRKKLNRRDLVLKDITIARESIDARDKKNIRRVYTVDFNADADLDLEKAPDLEYRYAEGGMPEKRPVIVGLGPCGMFCALIMAQMGMAPIVIERGRPIADRMKDVERVRQGGAPDPESNVQFGEGGAGTFSDGKLTTGIKDVRIRKVLEEFVRFGADKEILYKQRPHIGTDMLRPVVTAIREEAERLGAEVRFGCRLDDITTVTGGCSSDEPGVKRIRSVILSDGSEIFTDDLVLAMGHSARDTFAMLERRGLEMSRKPFSIGVRIEHPQSVIDRAQYGDAGLARVLGPAEYKLSYHIPDGRGVYTFCMCPGGEVILASSAEGEVVTNGMSYHARDGRFANSGLLVDVRPEDFDRYAYDGERAPSCIGGPGSVLSGADFQKRFETAAFRIAGGYSIPTATWGEFEGSAVEACLPDFCSGSIKKALPVLGRKLSGFDDPRARMYAVETRSSSPVRFTRDERFMSNIKGIYPAGEGAGHAGGIMSSAVDGIKIAESVALRYK